MLINAHQDKRILESVVSISYFANREWANHVKHDIPLRHYMEIVRTRGKITRYPYGIVALSSHPDNNDCSRGRINVYDIYLALAVALAVARAGII